MDHRLKQHFQWDQEHQEVNNDSISYRGNKKTRTKLPSRLHTISAYSGFTDEFDNYEDDYNYDTPVDQARLQKMYNNYSAKCINANKTQFFRVNHQDKGRHYFYFKFVGQNCEKQINQTIFSTGESNYLKICKENNNEDKLCAIPLDLTGLLEIAVLLVYCFVA